MRQAVNERRTLETYVQADINLDGSGKTDIDTKIGFFDHMLTLFGVHGLFDLKVKCAGDIEVDGHHSVEDTGIVLGDAFKTALGDCKGIRRYSTFYVPMDEVLARVSVDISNRPFLVFDAGELAPMIGSFDTQLAEEFFRAFAFHAGITVHIKVLYGQNSHHKIEAAFKALAHALRHAVERDPRVNTVPSSKGVL